MAAAHSQRPWIKHCKYVFCLILSVLGGNTVLTAGSEVYFAQALRGDPLNTTIVSVQNVDSLTAAVTVEFYRSSAQLEEMQQLTLDPNGSGSIMLGEEGLSLRAGWAVVKSDRRIVATAFYSFRVNQEQVPTIGVLPTEAYTQWRSFVKIEPGELNTGLAVANPDSQLTAHCQLTALQGSEGEAAGAAEFELGPRQQTAQFLTQRIPELAAGFEGSALLECDNPTAAVVLNQQRDGAVSTVAMSNPPGYKELYFAQALRGNVLNTTELSVQNVDTASSTVTVEFYSSSAQLEETQQLTLSANGIGKVVLGEEGLPLRAGWVVVRSTGRTVATAFYSFQVGDFQVPTVGVLPTESSIEWRSFIDIEPGMRNTGMAVSNPNQQATATCTLSTYRGANAELGGAAEFQLAPRRHTGQFLTQLIPDLSNGFEGAALLQCDNPVAAVVLNQRRDGATTTVAMGDTAALTYACGELLQDSANFLEQMLDPFTGLPYDQLRCNCRHQSEQGVCQSSGVVPQLADAEISVFAEDGARVEETVQWRFVDAVPQGATPTLLHALEIELQLSEQNRFGGLIWGATADISRYRAVRIRYRTADPSHIFEFKLNSGQPGSTVIERAVQLPGTPSDGSWVDVEYVVSDAFPGIDPRFLNYMVLATSRDLAGESPALWVDHIAFLSDPLAAPSCSVVLDCSDGSCYPDLARYEPLTGAVNIANALTALSLLPDIGLIDQPAARAKIEAILNSLGRMPRFGSNPAGDQVAAGWVQDWHSPASLMPDPVNRIASLTDQPQLYAALMVLESSWPELSEQASVLRRQMDFSILYESQSLQQGSCPGALHWAIDACQGVQSGELEFYGNDSLLGAFLAVATGAAPPQFWSHCLARQGCGLNGPSQAPWYTTGQFCENGEIPASETGGPFLQLAGLLYLDGAKLRPAPLSLSRSARNMLSAQADFALDTDAALWGWSNASDPNDCAYNTCESFTPAEVSPYICSMGLGLLPRRCGSNLLAFHRLGADAPLNTETVEHRFGLRDAWDQEANRGRDAYLYLDTGWTVLGLLNACHDDLVRQRFMQHPIAVEGYRLLAQEPPACSQSGAGDH